MRLSNPAPGRPVTSAYGWRIHPITKKRAFHRGTDFGGTFDVLAAAPGVVVHIGWSPKGGGHTVVIEHERDLFTAYYHGAHRTKLNVGDRVKTGDLVYRSAQLALVPGPTFTSRFAPVANGDQTYRPTHTSPSKAQPRSLSTV